jgi:hypothetical protein
VEEKHHSQAENELLSCFSPLQHCGEVSLYNSKNVISSDIPRKWNKLSRKPSLNIQKLDAKAC